MAMTEARRRIAWAAALSAAAGFVLGAWLSVPAMPAQAESAAGWALPPGAALQRQQPEDVALVSTSPLWRSRTAAGGDGGEDAKPTWRLAGVIGGEKPVALVIAGAPGREKTVRVAEGEALPDGSRLERMGPDSIIVLDDRGCRQTIRLYQGPGVRPEPSCDTPTPSSEPSPGSP